MRCSSSRSSRRSASRHLLLWTLVVGHLAAGCASVELEPPDLTLVDLRAAEATLFETSLRVSLRVTNPNPEALTFEGASFKLELDDRKIGRGVTAETITVERFDSQVVDVTFRVSNASLLLRLQQILESKRVDYGVTGKLYVVQGGRSRKLPVESSGTLDLKTPGTTVAGP